MYARPGSPPDDRTVLISIVRGGDDARAHTYTIPWSQILNANKSNAIIFDPADDGRLVHNNKVTVYLMYTRNTCIERGDAGREYPFIFKNILAYPF